MHDRYHRQRILSEIGERGQAHLRAGHAVLVGIGALGCITADMLARAGVGTITLIDRDIVDATNLQRQSLFTENDAREGTPKAEAARARLNAVNSAVDIRAVIADVTPARAEELIFSRQAPPPTAIVDGTDNFETRYILNDVSVKRSVPLVYGGAVGTRGTVAALVPGTTPCLRCLAPSPPKPGTVETCDTTGVLGPVVGIVASMQSAEAIKILSGNIGAVSGALVSIDAWRGEFRTVALRGTRDPACPCCGAQKFEFLESRSASGASVLCGRHTVQVTPSTHGRSVDLMAIESKLGAAALTMRTDSLVRATLDAERTEDAGHPVVVTVFADGRALISGIASPERARAIYARYVGL